MSGEKPNRKALAGAAATAALARVEVVHEAELDIRLPEMEFVPRGSDRGTCDTCGAENVDVVDVSMSVLMFSIGHSFCRACADRLHAKMLAVLDGGSA